MINPAFRVLGPALFGSLEILTWAPSLALVSLPRSDRAPGRRRTLLDLADTLPQRRLEVDWAAVFAQQIGEGLISELLEVPHAVPGEQVESVPGFLIELNALAGRAYPAVAL